MIGFIQFVENLSKSEKTVTEDMTAGDAGGNPEKIASGERSGAITLKSPETMGKGSRKKKEAQD